MQPEKIAISNASDTIAAIATAHGAAGIGIVRLSGAHAQTIAEILGEKTLLPRHATRIHLRDAAGDLIDDGIVLFFPQPHSYTGEDVVELQAHGSPILLARLLARCMELGARAARPGEFTERAFLNEKLDLAQAEAVADLISAGSEAAARAARRSLDGEFSRRIAAIVEQLIQLRVYVEAAMDFPDEEIDFLAAEDLHDRLHATTDALTTLRHDAEQGKRLMDGLHAVIVGAPNVGKSSLLNALAADDRAIVSEIAGTTRDLLRENLNLDGIALTLVDTAGLRQAGDAIEAEGIRRTHAEISHADLILAVLDDRDAGAQSALARELTTAPMTVWLHNKCDLSDSPAGAQMRADGQHLWLSARTGAGLELLRASLRAIARPGEDGDGGFSARARHLQALERAQDHIQQAILRVQESRGELAAEDLRRSQDALGEITGHVDSEALLGRIFSSFCIGK